MKKEDEQILEIYRKYRGKLQRLRFDTETQMERTKQTYELVRAQIQRDFYQDVNRLNQGDEIAWPL